MSYGYPDGCSQATHDRAFNELGPSPAELAAEADAQNDFDADYPEIFHEEMPRCANCGEVFTDYEPYTHTSDAERLPVHVHDCIPQLKPISTHVTKLPERP